MEKPEIKYVFSDLDDTLLVDQHIPEFNLEAINRIKSKGIKFIICSGRTYTQTIKILKELNTYEKENEYSILINGGCIIENKNQKILNYISLEFNLVSEIFNFVKNFDLCIELLTFDTIYIFKNDGNEPKVKEKQGTKFKIIENLDIDFLKKEKIGKIALCKVDGFDYLNEIKDKLNEKFKGKITLTVPKKGYLDIISYGINKGSAIKFFIKYFNLDRKNILAIGDNFNDIEMIKEAGIGCCVNNASEEVKKISDYVCKNDFKNGGFKEAIDKFI
jgi:Cof subfamily protein (haloacid dehalogenase superfamily)